MNLKIQRIKKKIILFLKIITCKFSDVADKSFNACAMADLKSVFTVFLSKLSSSFITLATVCAIFWKDAPNSLSGPNEKTF